MDRRDARQAPIVRVQSGRHHGKPGHQPIHRKRVPIGAAEQSLDFASLAHDKVRSAPLYERRSPEE
jgi:hypothetical protein